MSLYGCLLRAVSGHLKSNRRDIRKSDRFFGQQKAFDSSVAKYELTERGPCDTSYTDLQLERMQPNDFLAILHFQGQHSAYLYVVAPLLCYKHFSNAISNCNTMYLLMRNCLIRRKVFLWNTLLDKLERFNKICIQNGNASHFWVFILLQSYKLVTM